MAGYWIVRGSIRDRAAFEEYARLWKPIAERYGARYLAPGKAHQTREGRDYERVVIVEFPSYERAVACYDDPDYKAALVPAMQAYDRDLVIVDGD